jgi:menaquinone-9 beta-reductase
MSPQDVDLVVVGAGPAGSATALGALAEVPGLSVLMLDRADFPRDKACGDGVAPQVLDVLAGVGVTGLLDDHPPVSRLRLQRDGLVAERRMRRAAWVVPRTVLDARLVAAACRAGALLERRKVRLLQQDDRRVLLGEDLRARVVVGADGAHSQVRRSLGCPSGPRALALRGYAPTTAGRAEAQTIAFGTTRQPSYAWSFDRGDGWSNVGYGELLGPHRSAPTRQELLAQLDTLLPGAGVGGEQWQAHHLPLSTWRPPLAGRRRVMLAGDAAGLVNPLTGEGIYYAVVTGLLAGRVAARAVADGEENGAAGTYAGRVRRLLARHLRHTALAARLSLHEGVLDAGLRASARDQRVFDDLVELGLARGTLTPRLARGLVGAARRRSHHHEETPA